MNVDALKDAVRAAIEKIVPGGVVILLGTMLALALGLTWVLEAPLLMREATAELAQPFRTLILFCGLALPLIILGYAFRKGMGYIVSRIIRNSGERQ